MKGRNPFLFRSALILISPKTMTFGQSQSLFIQVSFDSDPYYNTYNGGVCRNPFLFRSALILLWSTRRGNQDCRRNPFLFRSALILFLESRYHVICYGRNPFLFRSALIRGQDGKRYHISPFVAIPFYSGQL